MRDSVRKMIEKFPMAIRLLMDALSRRNPNAPFVKVGKLTDEPPEEMEKFSLVTLDMSGLSDVPPEYTVTKKKVKKISSSIKAAMSDDSEIAPDVFENEVQEALLRAYLNASRDLNEVIREAISENPGFDASKFSVSVKANYEIVLTKKSEIVCDDILAEEILSDSLLENLIMCSGLMGDLMGSGMNDFGDLMSLMDPSSIYMDGSDENLSDLVIMFT